MGTDLTQMQPAPLALAIHFVYYSLLSQPLGGLQLAVGISSSLGGGKRLSFSKSYASSVRSG